jgi:formylglycine-generating enzyme required for sulfatase activity
MGWPLSQDYNEAVQSPARHFADADLRGGTVLTNALGLPAPYSGSFADVYQACAPDGTRWAVKCFTREVSGLRERYQQISRHLAQARLPFSVDFSYLEQGIRVAGVWYPVLKMEWVEGLTLNQFVARYVDKPAMLEALLQIWVRMGKYLRDAEIAHCDLQHGNVLLVPGGSANSLALKLIDYDGMWVPALAGKKSGEVGHPSYQHPQRVREETYSLEVDRFSLLLVATALRALMVKGGELWQKYDNGDNLLFKEADLQGPTKSHLFLDLIRSGDALTSELADYLMRALRGGVAAAPLLEDVLPEAQTATAVRASRPAAAPDGSRGGVAVAPAAVAVVARRGPVIRRARDRTKAARTGAWMVAAVLLACLGAGWAAFRAMQNGPGGGATGTAAAPKRVAEAESGDAQRDEPRVAPVAPAGEATPPERPKDSRPAEPPPKPKVPDKPEEVVKPPEKPKPPDKPPPPPVKPRPPVKPPAKPLEDKIITAKSLEMMRLVPIQAGSFRMGSPKGEAGRLDNEGPQHEVRITRPFYMGAYPVTKAEFAAFVKEMNFVTDAEKSRREQTWKNPGIEQKNDNEPVVCVSWYDAVSFCQWLSNKEKRICNLPTEAEWEFACRAGTKTAYHFANDAEMLDEYAWYRPNSGGHTHPVGGNRYNPWKLDDIYGNARQWCRDGLRPYTIDAVDDPVGPEADGDRRALRGGSWGSEARECRSAARMDYEPSKSNNRTGFRVVFEP